MKQKTYHHHAHLVSAQFQAFTFIISLLFLAIFLTISYQTFINLDPQYPLEPNNPHQSTSTISVGLHITQFNKFHVEQNIFDMVGTVWFAYDPQSVSLETIKKFSIDNGELTQVSEPSIVETGTYTIARFRIQAKFHSSLYYLLFPMDDHCINIVVTNDFLPTHVTFATPKNAMTLDTALALPGWRIINTQAKAGYTHFLPTSNDTTESTLQKAVFSLFLEHNNPMLTINIILTLLLLLFTTLLTFSSEEDCVLIVSIGMVALIGYRFVLQTFEPHNINYFTLADYMYLFALIGAITTLFFGIMTRERNSSVTTKKIIIALIYTLFVGGCSLVTFIL